MKYISFILLLLSVTAYGQAPSPISNTHILVYPAYGKLAEIKPDIQFAIPFDKKESYKEIVFHRTQYDTAAEYELLVTLKKKGTVTQPDPVISETVVDDRNPLIKYNPAWVPFTGTVYQDGTAQYTTTVGATATLQFMGNRIEYWAEKKFNHGYAGIRIDGGAEVEVDLYDKQTITDKAMIFSKDLPQGAHTIVIRMIGKKNPIWATDFPVGSALRSRAQEDNIVLDYLKYYSV